MRQIQTWMNEEEGRHMNTMRVCEKEGALPASGRSDGIPYWWHQIPGKCSSTANCPRERKTPAFPLRGTHIIACELFGPKIGIKIQRRDIHADSQKTA
jgi:hypothetical protein